MTIEELKTRPEFVTLGSEQMKNWVVAFCTNGGDKMKATETAYGCTTERSAMATANRNLADTRVKALLKLYLNDTEDVGSRDRARAIAWDRASKAGDDQLDWMKVYCELSGFKNEKPAEPPEGTDEVDYTAKLAALKGI